MTTNGTNIMFPEYYTSQQVLQMLGKSPGSTSLVGEYVKRGWLRDIRGYIKSDNSGTGIGAKRDRKEYKIDPVSVIEMRERLHAKALDIERRKREQAERQVERTRQPKPAPSLPLTAGDGVSRASIFEEMRKQTAVLERIERLLTTILSEAPTPNDVAVVVVQAVREAIG